MASQIAPKKPAMAFHAFVKKLPLSFKIESVSKLMLILLKVSPALSTIIIFQICQCFGKVFTTDNTTFEIHREINNQINLVAVTVVSNL